MLNDLGDLIELAADVFEVGSELLSTAADRRGKKKKQRRAKADAVQNEPWEREDRKPPWED